MTIALLRYGPIAQDLNYHLFSDTQLIWQIPNALNVLSNIPFFIVGLLGLTSLKRLTISRELSLAYQIFFLGVLLVAFGSGYYHLWPDNYSLVWDRLPMTIAFMALFAIVIGEFISTKLAQRLLWPLILLGLGSIAYWQYTESIGAGDLRFYIGVQFIPLISIILILFLVPVAQERKLGYWLLCACYVLAKITEFYDPHIHQLLGFISGHSLKHLLAALGIYLFYQRLLIQGEANEH